MNKKNLLSILDRINKDDGGSKKRSLHFNSKVLIVDGMNTFIRSFAVDNHHDRHGNHIGGISGFLKSLGSAIKMINPTRCIIVFDGEGGTTNRRYLYPDYKKNRDHSDRIVNWKSFSSQEEEHHSKKNEIGRLIDYLQMLPVTLVSIDKMEADDVMSYIAGKIYSEYDDSNICIYSTDKDFFQLVNDRIYVFSPTKKRHYYEDDILKEYGVHPRNYLLYKCLLGDDSDNIHGITGIGEKKVLSLFPNLASKETQGVQYLYETCENPPKNSVLYDRVLQGKHIVDLNYKIMDLINMNISEEQMEEIDQEILVKPKPLSKYDFIKIFHSDGMGSAILNIDSLLNTFGTLNSY